jgi:hypothetical protein
LYDWTRSREQIPSFGAFPMRFTLAALALLSAFILPSAHATPLTFVLNGGGDNYVFTLDSNPTPYTLVPGIDIFEASGIDTLNPAFSGPLYFAVAYGGSSQGVGFFPEIQLPGDTSVLYTPASSPGGTATFTPGTYSFEDLSSDPYTLTVSVASSPEPSSLALLGTGTLGVVGIVRRRIVR